jgi:TrmH family RNA methyltransferase
MKRVVLVRTSGPRNAGSVLRLVANFGPCELVLVRPEKPSLLIHPDFVQMAHGVEDVAARVRVVDSLSAALEDCTASVGFTARPRDHRELQDWRAVRSRLVERAHDPVERLALVFGNEESGLDGEETAPLGELVRIPTSDEHGSLNLAMAVGIVLSTIFLEPAAEVSVRVQNETPLPGADRAFLVERLKESLGAIPWTAAARRDLLASIERVFARAPLETRDARAWHMLLRALGNEKAPGDYGLRSGRARRESPAVRLEQASGMATLEADSPGPGRI